MMAQHLVILLIFLQVPRKFRNLSKTQSYFTYEPSHEKTNNVHCTATEADKKLEFSDLRRRGIVLAE